MDSSLKDKINNKFKKQKYVVYTSILIVLLLISVFFIKPSITGYSVYNEMKESGISLEDYKNHLKDLETKVLIQQTNLSTCKEYNEKLADEFSKISNKLIECTKNCSERISALEKMNYILQEKIKNQNIENLRLNEMIETLNNEKAYLTKTQKDYNELAKNTANNLCCKAKVDNPNIRYYKVENHRVICLESGELEINC